MQSRLVVGYGFFEATPESNPFVLNVILNIKVVLIKGETVGMGELVDSLGPIFKLGVGIRFSLDSYFLFQIRKKV